MKHAITRRHILKGAAALGFASGAPLFAFASDARREDAGKRSVVLIYLRGGADFLNMIVPRHDSTYELSRPSIAIREDSVLKLDDRWGLHPGLAAFKPLWDEKLLVPMICVGSPHSTRSHFDAQDFMNFAAPGNRTVHNGWLNRYLTATGNSEARSSNEFRALGMQRLLPTALRGDFPVLAVPDGFGSDRSRSVLERFEEFYGAKQRAKREPEMDPEDGMVGPGSSKRATPSKQMGGERDGGLDVLGSGKVTIQTLRRFREIVAAAGSEDHGYPRTSLGQGMANIAKVLQSGEGLEVAAIDYGGWDHHTGQGAGQGRQFNALSNLAGSIAAFRRHLGDAFENTTVLVMTEFGRTVRENGSAGTDHGHGSGMFLVGAGLRAGKVFGDWKGLRTDKLYQGRDLPVTTDFRNVIGTVLKEHMDFKVPRGFFPDHAYKKLRLYK